MASILLTEESGGGGGGDSVDIDNQTESTEKTQDQIIYEVAETSLAKFPPLFDMEIAKLKYPVKWDNSMNTVLVQELQRFNKLVSVCKESLKDVMNAVKGLTVMSAAIERSGNSLFFGKIPKKWLDASYPSLKPLAGYTSDLLERLKFFQKWLDTKAPPTFWVSDFTSLKRF